MLLCHRISSRALHCLYILLIGKFARIVITHTLTQHFASYWYAYTNLIRQLLNQIPSASEKHGVFVTTTDSNCNADHHSEWHRLVASDAWSVLCVYVYVCAQCCCYCCWRPNKYVRLMSQRLLLSHRLQKYLDALSVVLSNSVTTISSRTEQDAK